MHPIETEAGLVEHGGAERPRVSQFRVLEKPWGRRALARGHAKDGFCQRLVSVIATAQAIFRSDAVIDARKDRSFLEKTGFCEIVKADSRIGGCCAIRKREHVHYRLHRGR